MIILALRTDKPAAELYLYQGKEQLAEVKWQANRQLAATIHSKTQEILDKSSISWADIEGIVCFKGPGSFTGLRIGHSVANALAYAQKIPIVAAGGQDWLDQGIEDLLSGRNHKIAAPEYGSPVKTTPPKK